MISRHFVAARAAGFTLIELMVVVSIVAILAAIAIPSYGAYVQRSRIVEATTRLSDFRVRMEQFFLDNRRYTAPDGSCGVPDPTPASSDSFTVTCPKPADNTHYRVQADGIATKSMTDFQYTLDQNGAKTSKGPTGWPSSDSCWVIKKDGTCG